MDFNATIDLIIKDLEEAREIIDDLKKYKDVPALQVEIAKSKCKSAAEIIALLKNMSIRQDPEKEKDSESKISESKISETKISESKIPETKIPESKIPEQKTPEPPPVKELFKEEVQQPVVKPEEVRDQPEPVNIISGKESNDDEAEILPNFKPGIKNEESSVKRARARILAEEIEDERRKAAARLTDTKVPDVKPVESKAKNEVNPVQSAAPQEFINEVELKRSSIIADRFRKLDDDDFSGIMKTRPLTSLSDAIGINDSFYFIREIFNGNKSTYSEALLKLEKAESLKDARAVIMSYTGQKADNEASLQLLDLVKRKLLLHG
jgi:hypothetical protein